jgi:asparagine synthase (glutamine-hydrolysing)
VCGIAGFTNFHSSLSDREQIITAMCDALSHRGPDEWGQQVFDEVALGHRRLSIVGLSDGKQPMVSEKHGLAINFNGEIYNYKTLRERLKMDGFEFRTSTDTEVILYLYVKYGVEAFKYLNGMFALAIWDLNTKQLVLARDRMGKKPLFYFHKNGDLVFSSELKSLIKHPRFSKKLSLKALSKFLTYEYIPSPYSIFEDTWKLEAGEFLVFDGHKLTKSFYWQHPNIELSGSTIGSEEEAASKIENILEDAVDIRLQADVPVGVLLSGGIDSSLVTALAVKKLKEKDSRHKLQSFSIYFKERSYDESEYINLMVKKFDLDHHYEYISSQDMLELFPRLGSIMDEPMADPSIVPTYFLSRIAAKNVKTVLGGDGADELFAGYPTYIANKLINIYNIIPFNLRNLITQLISSCEGSLLPVSKANISLDFKLKQFLRGAGVASEIRFFRWMGGFLDQEKRQILNSEVQKELLGELAYEDLNRFLSRTNITSELERLLYLSQKMYLTEDVLVKVDRASMMSSLEVRAPYLDYRLVEYASSLSERYKLKGFQTKYILKQVAKKYLPARIINRPKKGFGVPITEWLSTDLKEPMYDLLSKENLSKLGIFDYSAVKQLIDDHLERKTNNRKLLWTLLSFQLWAKEIL